jgi:hypothetical protein
VLAMAVLAIACGEMHTAAATPASTGAAAADSRREIRYRDVLLWAPKGLLSEQYALPSGRPRNVHAAFGSA